MISIRKYLDRSASDEVLREAFLALVESLIATMQARVLVTDSEEHTWFCTSLEQLRKRLREDSSTAGVEVVSALLSKTVDDHWTKISRQTQSREEELKRIINLLTEGASQLDSVNKGFYLQLRNAVSSFENISQMEDITYMRKKLSEQVSTLQEAVSRQEVVSHDTIGRLQQELDQAHQQIATLAMAASHDGLTRLPARQECEKAIRKRVEAEQPFIVAMAVVDRLDLINLRYGAETGDDVLRKFAKSLREQLPRRLFVGRWGGPAFIAIFDHVSTTEARATLQKVLSVIASDAVEVRTRGSGLLHIVSKLAAHQWQPGQAAEKVVRVVDLFCASQSPDTAEDEVAPS